MSSIDTDLGGQFMDVNKMGVWFWWSEIEQWSRAKMSDDRSTLTELSRLAISETLDGTRLSSLTFDPALARKLIGRRF